MELAYNHSKAIEYLEKTDTDQLKLNYQYNQARGYNTRARFVRIPDTWNAIWDRFGPVDINGFNLSIGQIRKEMNLLKQVDSINRSIPYLRKEGQLNEAENLKNQIPQLLGQRLRILEGKVVTAKECKNYKTYQKLPLILDYKSARHIKALLLHLAGLLYKNYAQQNSGAVQILQREDKTLQPSSIS